MRVRTAAGVIVLGLAFLTMVASASGETSWKCAARPIDACATRHGRLSSQNGISLKVWLIGTTRMVALDNNVDDLPPLIQKYLDMTSVDHSYIFGDFDICPLEPDVPARLRRVCVIGAGKLVIQPLDRSRKPFRLVSTWPKETEQKDPLRRNNTR
jgi:hypothetical protein